MFPRLYSLEGLRCKEVFGGLMEGARRATGVSPHRPLRLDILSVLAYLSANRQARKPGGIQYGKIAR